MLPDCFGHLHPISPFGTSVAHATSLTMLGIGKTQHLSKTAEPNTTT